MLEAFEEFLQWISENADILWKVIVAISAAIIILGIIAKYRQGKKYVD